MRSRSIKLAVFVGFAVVLAGGPVGAETAPIEEADIQKSLGANWYSMYVGGNKVGLLYKSLTEAGEGEDKVYVETLKINMKAKAQDQSVEMQRSTLIEFEARAPYRVRKVRSWVKQGRSLTKLDIATLATGPEYAITLVKDGNTINDKAATLNYDLADSIKTGAWLRGGAKAGETISTRVLAGTYQETRRLVETPKGDKGAFVVEVSGIPQREKFTERYDAEGRLLSGRLDELTEIRLDSQEEATTIETLLDFYAFQTVKIDEPIGEINKVAELVVEVVGEGVKSIETGPRQSAVRNESGTYTYKLGRRHGQLTAATAEETQEYLAESPTFPTRNPQVQALVKQAVGDATASYEKVKRLIRFVNEHLTYEYNGTNLAIGDILQSRKGDCTEFSTLFTTLARAAGIPARRVGGLTYSGDRTRTFEPHAWNEVVINGYWMPVDPTWREVEANPTHIRLSIDLDRADKGSTSLNNVSFKLIDVKRRDG